MPLTYVVRSCRGSRPYLRSAARAQEANHNRRKRPCSRAECTSAAVTQLDTRKWPCHERCIPGATPALKHNPKLSRSRAVLTFSGSTTSRRARSPPHERLQDQDLEHHHRIIGWPTPFDSSDRFSAVASLGQKASNTINAASFTSGSPFSERRWQRLSRSRKFKVTHPSPPCRSLLELTA